MIDYKEVFSRNIGLISEAEQELVANAVIGIAGTGADGGLAAERIARMGVKKIKLADPELFDLSNINRQFGATENTEGKNKCEVVADEIRKIRSNIEVETYPEGVNEQNSEEFVDGCSVILDEIEYTKPLASVSLHRAARKSGLEVFAGLNLAFGLNLFRFLPNGLTFEQILGTDGKIDENSFRMETLVPNIPSYVDKKVVEKVLKRESFVPTISPTIGLLSGFLSFAVLSNLIGRWQIPAVPEFLHFDIVENKIEYLKIG